MIKEAIGTVAGGRSLTVEEAASVMEEIMDGKTTPAQLGAFITALSIKGESAEEIAGLARVMRSRATRVQINEPVLDVVGTGGDGLNTINISTAAAFVAAARNSSASACVSQDVTSARACFPSGPRR